MSRRNSSNKYDHYRIIYLDGSEKICKSDTAYERHIRNNDNHQIKAVWYNNIRQSQDYIEWIRNQ